MNSFQIDNETQRDLYRFFLIQNDTPPKNRIPTLIFFYQPAINSVRRNHLNAMFITAAFWLLIATVPIGRTNAATKIWKSDDQNTGWKVMNDQSKCAEHTIVYTAASTIELSVPTNQYAVIRIVLPQTGVVLLNASQPIVLQAIVPPPCSWRFNGNYMYHDTWFYSWFKADMWQTADDKTAMPNSAIPTVNRVPCECDDVVFPRGKSAAVYVDVNVDISVASVTVNGRRGDFAQFLRSQMGQTMFYMEEADTVLMSEHNCDERKYCGCHSYRRHVEHMDFMCKSATSGGGCPVAHCMQPITPIGFCCPQCGAAIITRFDSKNHTACGKDKAAQMEQLRWDVRHYMGEKWSELVDIYVDYFPNESDDNNLLQLTVMDRVAESAEYSGKSVEFVKKYMSEAKCKQIIFFHLAEINFFFS